MDLIVNEIFYSLQGESTIAGFPSLFIRLTGCNLNCSYCDTEYAKSSGKKTRIEEVIQDITTFRNANRITVTGGEPLMQSNSINLMQRLSDNGYHVQLETNGSIDLHDVPWEVRKVVDVKTPSSGEVASFLFENLKYIHRPDEIKFVIADIDDYKFSKDFVEKNLNKKGIVINFSPVPEKMSASKLAELILVDRLKVRLNIQLHKVIWPNGEPKRYEEYR